MDFQEYKEHIDTLGNNPKQYDDWKKIITYALDYAEDYHGVSIIDMVFDRVDALANSKGCETIARVIKELLLDSNLKRKDLDYFYDMEDFIDRFRIAVDKKKIRGVFDADVLDRFLYSNDMDISGQFRILRQLYLLGYLKNNITKKDFLSNNFLNKIKTKYPLDWVDAIIHSSLYTGIGYQSIAKHIIKGLKSEDNQLEQSDLDEYLNKWQETKDIHELKNSLTIEFNNTVTPNSGWGNTSAFYGEQAA